MVEVAYSKAKVQILSGLCILRKKKILVMEGLQIYVYINRYLEYAIKNKHTIYKREKKGLISKAGYLSVVKECKNKVNMSRGLVEPELAKNAKRN